MVVQEPGPVTPATVPELRRWAAESRFPRKQLLTAVFDWAEADERVHRLDVAEAFRRRGQPPMADEYAAAVSARTAAFGRLEELRDYVGEIHLSGFAHALDRLPDELGDLLARAITLPGAKIALVRCLEVLLGPTFDYLVEQNATLRAETAELRGRVADLEAVAAGVDR
ncbi:hypothetical protein PX52LOC_07501 [Limnoglobus roseus]|uniref:Uncharacterized protein n=2 Tax=Limnoglobus roseus TaxID=2598579 RepID=A0A5C1AQE0_9BACT|nr:hypothetical protein PX52LOC_07501 [Limnoglobus roseus]